MTTQQKIIGLYECYPDNTGARHAEGGARVNGRTRTRRTDIPLVTIVTVCWNAGKTLEKAMQSVASQTYDNLEYVVVDGGSDDGTVDLLNARAHMIDYFVSEPDEGLYFAMNKGLELAQGEFILFLNADDWYETDTVEQLVRAQQSSGAYFVSALANYVDGEGNFVRVQPASAFDAGVEFRMPLRHETMLVPAWIYDAAGYYDTSYRVIADRVYTAGLFWRGYTHHLLPAPLLNFSMEGVSSVNLDSLYAERERALGARFPGLSVMAMRDLVNLEQVSLERLCEISRNYGDPVFRAVATAYALDREAQGHTAWQDVDLNAFSPALQMRTPYNRDAARDRHAHAQMSPPKVSVILPVYNAEDSLHECLDSLLAQTLADIEIICLNDASPDDSQRIIDDYGRRDTRIKIRLNEINIGLGATRNRGIALAQGTYIFHIDPDDVIPENALALLVARGDADGSDMVRGAFLHEQLLMGQASGGGTRKGIDPAQAPVINTTLAQMPDLLRSTEGHWSYLYRSDFAKRVFYPEDLKMGQDSIFLVQAVSRARSISIIADVIYHYRANPKSAMNVFSFRKYVDEIEWRARAWSELDVRGFTDLGDHLLCNYWNIPFFETLDAQFDAAQKRDFFRRLAYAFAVAGNGDLSKTTNPALRAKLQAGLGHFACLSNRPLSEPDTGSDRGDDARPLRIAMISTTDHGGAGLACLRSVQGLRAQSHDVTLYALFPTGDPAYTWRLPIKSSHHAQSFDEDALRQIWRRMAVLNRQEEPNLIARELFSKVGSVVDTAALGAVLRDADVVHLHWTSGTIDFDEMTALVGDTPVVWTFHDMNPITGGCHYSEDCEGYRDQCRVCPLLSSASDMAHRAWLKKDKAFAQVRSLEVIAPSEWLAECTRHSSLLGDRTVHVLPNIFPCEDFEPTNKIVARQKLGLPLDKKLFVFGADSLDNRRKGGDILRESLKYLRQMDGDEGVEGIFFGASTLELDVPVHAMGYVNDPVRLSLIYSAADVFAFPSREDNAPQTVIEALMSGTPVVGFGVGNLPETVIHERTGYIARDRDPKDFARGLAWALAAANTPEGLQRGLRAHIAARRHNDPHSAIAQHLQVYRALLDTAG
jgi:glycosyltransferase involved in cell wall biosynthesis